MVAGCFESGNETPSFIKCRNLFISEPKSASQTGLFHDLTNVYTRSHSGSGPGRIRGPTAVCTNASVCISCIYVSSST